MKQNLSRRLTKNVKPESLFVFFFQFLFSLLESAVCKPNHNFERKIDEILFMTTLSWGVWWHVKWTIFSCPCSPWDRNKNMMYNVDRWWLEALFWKVRKTLKQSLEGSKKRFASQSVVRCCSELSQTNYFEASLFTFANILCGKKVLSASSWKFFKHSTHSSS